MNNPTGLRRSISAALCPWLLLAVVARADSPAPATRLPRTNLLVYHDRQGQVVPVRTRTDWQKRRAEVLRGMEEIMGPLPGKSKRCPLAMQMEEEKDCGDYVRRLITYASEPGSRVPAYLLIPKAALGSKKKFPAVLALHPPDMEHGPPVLVDNR